MRFSEADGRKVVSTSTAETVGKVSGFVVDPARRTVIAVELKKADHGDTLLWSDIVGFGADAITVEDAEKIGSATAETNALSGKDHQVLGKRVLSSAGDELGAVADVAFEPETGEITGLILKDAEVTGDRLIGVGSYAVVVAAE
jgi:uncharacterized protein YrrD